MALYESKPLTAPHLFTDGIEGPAVDRSGILYAVNFGRPGTIGAVTPQGDAYLFIELPKGSVGNGIRFRKDGTMLIADYTGHKILSVDMNTRKVSVLAHDPTMSQPNDICISESGMVFASDPDWKTSTGRIWRCEENGVLRLIARDHGTVNGIEISPDERILYVNESVQRKIWAYDLTIGSDLKRKRLFTEFSDFGLDGMRCDVAGNLYVTRYGKGTILKLSPHGKALKEIKLHGAKPSNLAFGGEDGKTVYVTEVEQGRVEQFQVEEPGREWKLLR